MEIPSLTEQFKTDWFEVYQAGIVARFEASRMKYSYSYSKEGGIKSVIVHLGKNDETSRIELTETGTLKFDYTFNNNTSKEHFRNCDEEDFHTMMAYVFIYLRDGSKHQHKEWYTSLELID
ncbi:MAG: hypothetical protein ACI9N1_003191 [Flavobacteriales bacterium]|jgi:hypothetical protein